MWAFAFCAGGWAHADSLTLDSSGSSPNTPAGGAANWDTSAGNIVWSNVLTAPAGTAQDSAWNNSANNIAVLNVQTSGALVAIDAGNVTAGGLIFGNTIGNPSVGYVVTNNGVAANTLTLSGAAPFITTNGGATIEAVIAGTSGFTKNGTAALTLEASPSVTGSNTYTGTATVAAGELNLVGASGTLITGDLTINSGAVVETEGANLIASTSNLKVNGTLAIGYSVPGYTGTFMGGAESVAGLTGSGAVQLGIAANAQAPTLTLNPTQSQTFAGTISGQGSIAINAAASDVVQTLTGNNGAWQGSVAVNTGVLSVNSVNALGNQPFVALNGGTIRYTGPATGSYVSFSTGANGGTLDASGTGAVNFYGAATSPTVGTGSDLTLTGTSTAANTLLIPASQQAGSLVKNGAGTWILGGASTTFVGGAQLNQGIMELANNGSLGQSAITLGPSGTLEIVSESTSLGNISGNGFTAAGGTLILNNSPSVDLENLVRPSGGGMVIVPTSSTALGSTEKVISSGVTTAFGIADASFVAQNSMTDSSGDFLNVSGANGFVRATYSTATAITNNVSGGTSNTSVFHATTATNNNVTAATTLYALKIDSGVTVNGSLTLGDGAHTAGLIMNSNSSTVPTTINGSVLLGSSEGAFYVGGNVTPGSTPALPFADIAGTVAGTNGMTKSGIGVLEIGNAQYTGATTINQGTLVFDGSINGGLNSGTRSTSVINLAGTVMFNGAGQGVQSTINLTGDGTIATAAPGGSTNMTFTGTINGNGHALNITNGVSYGVVALQGAENNIAQYNVNLGGLQIGGTLGSTNAPIVVTDGPNSAQSTLLVNGGSTVANAVVLNQGLLAVTSSGTATTTGSITVQGVGDFVSGGTGNLVLAGSIQGSAPLYFAGTGTTTISGTANTYSGILGVGSGTAVVTGNIASANSVSVGSGVGSTAVLAGTGTVSQINLGLGGKLSPGLAGIGTLTASGMSWNSDGTGQLQFDLGMTGNAADEVNLGSGSFTKASFGTRFVFDFENSGAAGQDYTLITFGANDTTFIPSDFQASDLAPGLIGSFSLVDNGTTESLDLAIAEAPEPGTTGLMVAGVLGLLLRARLRRRGESTPRRYKDYRLR